MERLSSVIQGKAAELLVSIKLMLGSIGELEISWPETDDERRDLEAHIRDSFLQGLIFQVKSTTYVEHRWKARHVEIHFPVPRNRLISHPLFWYLFGFLDVPALDFDDPLFLVPSEEVHKHANPELTEKGWNFNFTASLEPDAKDHWRPFQTTRKELANKVLAIIRDRPASVPLLLTLGSSLQLPEGIMLVRPRLNA